MKYLLTLIVLYTLCGSITYAQPDESRDFLVLYSDSVIYANRIDLERDYTGSLRLWVDSRSVPAGQVKFVNNNRGFFANVKEFNTTGETRFSERIRKGKLNLFEMRTIDWENYHNPAVYSTSPSVERKNYYNIGYSRLKKTNYVNLSIDLASNPESMSFLKKYQNIRRAQTAMYVTAGLSVIGGVIALLSENDEIESGFGKAPGSGINKSDRSFGFATGAVMFGIGLAAGGYLIGPLQKGYLKRAIDTYND